MALAMATAMRVPPGKPMFGGTLKLGEVYDASLQRRSTIVMAVPKRRRSKTRIKHRHYAQLLKFQRQWKKAYSLGKSVLTGRSNSFYYPLADDDEEDEDEEEEDEPGATAKCSRWDYALTEEGLAEENEQIIPEESLDAASSRSDYHLLERISAQIPKQVFDWLKRA